MGAMSDAYRGRSKNACIVRDDVGRAKTTCYDLPSEGFAYGRPEHPDAEGAREVTMHWASHVPRPRPHDGAQDFRKINKLATRDGVCNAKQLADFRRGADVALARPTAAGPLPKVIPSDVIPSFSYGKKSRPSTPIAHVVSYQYCAEYEDAVHRNYDLYECEATAANGVRRVRLTKAASAQIQGARQRRADGPTADGPMAGQRWKMTKFSRVPSRLHLAPGEAPSSQMNRSISLPSLGKVGSCGASAEVLE